MAFMIQPQGDLRSRLPRQQDKEHRAFIVTLRCTTCPNSTHIECAHIRFASPEHGKRETGMAEKPDDKWTVPLCPSCHREGESAQHKSNEVQWWEAQGIDPLELAEALHAVSGDWDAGMDLILNGTVERRT